MNGASAIRLATKTIDLGRFLAWWWIDKGAGLIDCSLVQAPGDGVHQQGGGTVEPSEAVGRQQLGQARLCLLDAGRAARGIQTLQQGWDRFGPLAGVAGLAPPR